MASDDQKTVRIGILGCGTVGASLIALIENDREEIARRTRVVLEVVSVAVRDLKKIRAVNLADGVFTADAKALVSDPTIDIVVEVIGIEPARELILGALAAGKPVITANKELLASCGGELYDAANAADRDLLFEGAVAGAIPILRALQVSLRGERIRRVMGIVNGTTNYILSRMSEERVGYSEALLEAQRLGYAEADPSADVGGFDAAAKAAILAGVAFDADVVADDVYREGIERIDVADIDFAQRLGYEVKLLAVVDRGDDALGDDPLNLAVRVHPAMIPKEHPLAGVRGPFNAVFVEGESSDEVMFYGRGAGGRPTASAVLGDIIDAASHLGESGRIRLPLRHRVAVRAMDELRAQYYVAIDVVDRPGVLAAVATIFGEHAVSIRSMEQVGLSEQARLVFITHTAREADVQVTLGALGDLDTVKRIGGMLRVIGPER